MQPSITTEHSLGGGDVSVFSNPDQLLSSRVDRTNNSDLDRELSYGRLSFGYVSNSSALGMVGRNGVVSQSNLDPTPC